MTSAWKVQQFLKLKFDQNKFDKKEFSRSSNIPYSTLCKIINGFQRNTELKTIIKIADYFNCSLDEVIGRDSISSVKLGNYRQLTKEDIKSNLKKYLDFKLKELSLNSYQLAKKCGFSDIALYEFMKNNTNEKKLGSSVIIGLADYFHISLDEMIGRTADKVEFSKNIPTILSNFNSQDLETLDKSKESISINLHKESISKKFKMQKSNNIVIKR